MPAAPLDVPVARRIDNALALVCGLGLCAGSMNVIAAAVDLGAHPGYGTLRLLAGVGQLLWAVALYRVPSRGLLRVGAIAGVAVVAGWTVLQAGVLPSGGSAWRAAPASPLDLLAAVDAIVLALCVAARSERRRGMHLLRGLSATSGLALVMVSSLALAVAPEGYAHESGGGAWSAASLFYCPLGQSRAHQ